MGASVNGYIGYTGIVGLYNDEVHYLSLFIVMSSDIPAFCICRGAVDLDR